MAHVRECACARVRASASARARARARPPALAPHRFWPRLSVCSALLLPADPSSCPRLPFPRPRALRTLCGLQAEQLLETARRKRQERASRWAGASEQARATTAGSGVERAGSEAVLGRPRRAVSSHEVSERSDDAFEEMRREIQRRASARRLSARGLPTEGEPSPEGAAANGDERPLPLRHRATSASAMAPPTAPDSGAANGAGARPARPPRVFKRVASVHAESASAQLPFQRYAPSQQGLEHPSTDDAVVGTRTRGDDDSGGGGGESDGDGDGDGAVGDSFSPVAGMRDALRWLVSREEEVETAEEIEAAKSAAKAARVASQRRASKAGGGSGNTDEGGGTTESTSPSSSIGPPGSVPAVTGVGRVVSTAVGGAATLARQLSFEAIRKKKELLRKNGGPGGKPNGQTSVLQRKCAAD